MNLDFPHDDLDQAAQRRPIPEAAKPKFPCQSCAGTGRWQRGRVNRDGKAECFACGGRGFFLKSYADRQAESQKRAAKKADRIAALQEEFEKAFPGLIARARAVAGWHRFAAELIGKFEQYGDLSNAQALALAASLDKAEASRARKAEERASLGGAVDISVIQRMFDGAKVKRPAYRAEGLTLSKAAPTGANPGAIYVKDGETYLGKIIGGEFKAGRDAGADTLGKLRTIAENPLEAAVRYGRLTGRCSICARTLTDKDSVERGIGPICAANMGI